MRLDQKTLPHAYGYYLKFVTAIRKLTLESILILSTLSYVCAPVPRNRISHLLVFLKHPQPIAFFVCT